MALIALLVPYGLSASVLVGDCRLDSDPRMELGPPIVCLKAALELNAISRSVDPRRFSLSEGEMYLGLHATSRLSLHARGRAVQLTDHDAQKSREALTTRSSYIAFGNPALDRWQILAGQFYLPFGLDYSPTMPIYRELYRRRFFWRTAKPSVSFSYGDLAGTKLELSWADDAGWGLFDKTAEMPAAFAGRFSSDLSALGGTRLILSYFKDAEGLRKMGFATLNVSSKGSVTSFEWLRYKDKYHAGRYPFHQMIRFGHNSAFIKKTRWVFEYEDDLELYFLTQLGHDMQVGGSALFRMNLGYYRSRFEDEENHWIFALGMRAEL